MLPKTSASGPVPTMPTVNSRPGKKRLDQHRLAIAGQQFAADRQERVAVGDLRGRRHPLAGPLAHRLGEQRRRQRHARNIFDPLDDGEIGRGQAGVADDRLRQSLVQASRPARGDRKTCRESGRGRGWRAPGPRGRGRAAPRRC